MVTLTVALSLLHVLARAQEEAKGEAKPAAPLPDRPVFTRFEIERERTEHRVRAGATLRNPGPQDLLDLWISVVYFDGDRQVRESKGCHLDRLPARGCVPFTLDALQVEQFSRYEVQLDHEGRRLTYSGKVTDATPSFQKAEALQKPAEGAAKAGGAPAVTVEVRGIKWYDRDPLDVREGEPGDVPYLRLAFRRGAKETYPVGKVRILLFDGPKSFRFLNLDLMDACWARDAAELQSRTALPELVAYDAMTGELRIGLTRVNHAKIELRADVALILEDCGTWEWKGLEKSFASAPKGPDRP